MRIYECAVFVFCGRSLMEHTKLSFSEDSLKIRRQWNMSREIWRNIMDTRCMCAAQANPHMTNEEVLSKPQQIQFNSNRQTHDEKANDGNLINFNSVESNKWLVTHLGTTCVVYLNDAAVASLFGTRVKLVVNYIQMSFLSCSNFTSLARSYCCLLLMFDSESNFPKLHRLTIKLPALFFLLLLCDARVHRACYFQIKKNCVSSLGFDKRPRDYIHGDDRSEEETRRKTTPGMAQEEEKEMNVEHKPKHKLDFILLRLQSGEMKWDL